jgi:acyl transferase domain-containing protein
LSDQLNNKSTNGANDGLSALQRAALTIKELRSKLDASKLSGKEPIAIVGMSCKFPGASNLEEYWHLLSNGVDAVSEVPKSRWDLEKWFDPNPATPGKINTRYGGFIEGVEYFDAPFFGIPSREAKLMDPGQRILLEQVWSALEHAGIPPDSLKGSNTGFFVGMSQNDYGSMQINGDPEEISAYSGTGNGYCFASGRIAYQFGFHGPTMTSDTACSSSIVALYQAVNAIRNGESNIAIASGVQLNLTPPMQVFFSRTQSFSPDGKCFTFDERANGFILGEGIGVVVLQKLSDAVKQGRRILGVIRETCLNHGGAAVGLTVPNETAQEMLIRQTLKRGKIDPDSIDYIETHGTGTNLGDPIEVGALKSVFGQRSAEQPLYLGSVKTNIGHLNAAAGIAGFIKTVLMLDHGKIAPNLHFKNPNPKIPWDGFAAKVPTELMTWPQLQDRPRRAGVSSFGLSGTNGHVILEEPSVKESAIKNHDPRTRYLFAISAKAVENLKSLASSHIGFIRKNRESLNLADYCFTANVGRSHLEHRAIIITSGFDDLIDALVSIQDGIAHPNVSTGISKKRGTVKSVNDIIDSDEELKQFIGDDFATDLIHHQDKFFKVVVDLYLNGWNLDWRDIEGDYGQKFMSIPTYTFTRDAHWVDVKKDTSQDSSVRSVVNPIRGISCSVPKPDIVKNNPASESAIGKEAYPLSSQSKTNNEQLQNGIHPSSTPANEKAAIPTSLPGLMEMQLRLATEALKSVTDQQFEFLRSNFSKQSSSKSNKESKPEPTVQHSVTNAVDSPVACGQYRLLVREYPPDVDLESAKKSLQQNLSTDESTALAHSASYLSNAPSGKRIMLVYNDKKEACAVLSDPENKKFILTEPPKHAPGMIFMFPGIGDHYINMGKGLYQNDASFRTTVDYCCNLVKPITQTDLRDVLFPVEPEKSNADTTEKPKFDFKAMMGKGGTVDPSQKMMNETRFSQPLLFIIEYALGKLWLERGVKPEAMIGYSIGEYAAAVLAGVMSLDDALSLVSKRAQLIESVPGGTMLAVPLSEVETEKKLFGSLSVAICSTPNQTVVAGPLAEIESLEKTLLEKEIMCRKLQSTHAFHTEMLRSLHEPLLELIKTFKLSPPTIPFISNVTGNWIQASEATDPDYWARHTWQKVRFAEGMAHLLNPTALNGNTSRIFLEVGPGVSLGSFMLQHPDAKQIPSKVNLPSLRTMYERTPDEQFLLNTTGKLFMVGYPFSTDHQLSRSIS